MTLPRFSPDSVFWRVNREWLLGLVGSRALLMELAHPLVAAGVAEHSDFRRNPLGRLYRTAWTMTLLTFGDEALAQRGARHFRRCHRPVRGGLTESIGPFPAGTEYDANDPFLKLWVLATLIDSLLHMYDLFIAPLSSKDREAYYYDTQRFAQWFDLSPALMPATYADFSAYMEAMLTSEVLVVGPAAREIVAALFPPSPFGSVARAASFVGLGLLPGRLRAMYGIEWGARRARWLRRLAAYSRRARPWLPDFLCVNPLALTAEVRWRQGLRLTAEARR
jgi:uncharacterized protein (DUF2236 family)